LLAALAPATPVTAGFVGRERVASGISQPVAVVQPPGDPSRLFVVSKGGTIRIVNLGTGVVESTPFLTVAGVNASHNESGLLGLAFHPDYQSNGKFYINATVGTGSGEIFQGQASPFDTEIREYTVSSNPNIANAAYRTVLRQAQPRAWHNAGWVSFNPMDGYLYTSLGDGGLQFTRDPTSYLLGSIVRIDVDGDDFPESDIQNYAIPDDNPFLGDHPNRDEIWAYGLRNPWRNSFDRATGDLWIGDVGDSTFEEVNRVAAGDSGHDFGWPIREGSEPFPGSGGGPLPGAVDPLYEYPHPVGPTPDPFSGRAITGGYVYRGPDPTLRGMYVFGDASTGKLWMFDPVDPFGTRREFTADVPKDVGSAVLASSFGEDIDGNLYIAYVASGEVYRLVTDTVTPGDFNSNGYVGRNDLGIWRTEFAMPSGASIGDADGDGDVDGADLLLWQGHVGVDPLDVGTAMVGGQAVPEPRTWLIALVMAPGLALRAAGGRRFSCPLGARR
jgi:glucose/arabinose dehydrogenase